MNSKNLRIVSLIPSATEIIYLLGLQKYLVARSAECNFPKDVLKKPVVVDCPVDEGMSSREIDQFFKNAGHQGRGFYHVDQKLLKKIKPNLILTQEFCEVCAIPFTQVKKAARFLKGDVNILSLEPQSIEDMFKNILTVGSFAGKLTKAQKEVLNLRKNLEIIKLKTSSLKKPSVIIIEWLSPIMIAGHWVPEMAQSAGAKMLLSKPFDKSRLVIWDEVLKADPDILIFAPCGFNTKRTKKEVGMFERKKSWKKLKAVKNKKVFIVDGDAYLTRSGPRLIKGVQILSKIFHPEVNFNNL